MKPQVQTSEPQRRGWVRESAEDAKIFPENKVKIHSLSLSLSLSFCVDSQGNSKLGYADVREPTGVPD
jgi:hypothetical protein